MSHLEMNASSQNCAEELEFIYLDAPLVSQATEQALTA